MLAVLVAGQEDAEAMAELARGKLRKEIPWAGLCPGNEEFGVTRLRGDPCGA